MVALKNQSLPVANPSRLALGWTSFSATFQSSCTLGFIKIIMLPVPIESKYFFQTNFHKLGFCNMQTYTVIGIYQLQFWI